MIELRKYGSVTDKKCPSCEEGHMMISFHWKWTAEGRLEMCDSCSYEVLDFESERADEKSD